jgi:hypothetical protein
LDELDLFYVHNGLIMFGPFSTMQSIRQNIRFLREIERCQNWGNIDNTLILTPGAVIYEAMLEEGKVLARDNFWDVPAYEFDDQRVVTLAKHYADLRTLCPHTNRGENAFHIGQNIISRLKNKMNQRVAITCAQEVDEYKKVFYRNKTLVNNLVYQGFVEDLNRVEKDGPNAVLNSEPYFGTSYKTAVDEVEKAYTALVDAIQVTGFGMGGLIFNYQESAWGHKNRHHFSLDEPNSSLKVATIGGELVTASPVEKS